MSRADWLKIAGIVTLCALVVIYLERQERRYADALNASAKWRWEHITKPQMDACYKLGGVPIYSSWNAVVERCDFPPAVRP